MMISGGKFAGVTNLAYLCPASYNRLLLTWKKIITKSY